MLNTLLYAQLLKIDIENREFTLKLQNGDIRHYKIVEDEGDCCGYNICDILIIDNDEIQRNPIITKIIVEKNEDSYECDTLKMTFFGEYKAIAEINSLSSSGSGWAYGACVTLECRETNEQYLLTSY